MAELKGGSADAILIDGNRVPEQLQSATTEAVIKGDAKCLSVAAASILAKVTRDRIMLELHDQYPVCVWCVCDGRVEPNFVRVNATPQPLLNHARWLTAASNPLHEVYGRGPSRALVPRNPIHHSAAHTFGF